MALVRVVQEVPSSPQDEDEQDRDADAEEGHHRRGQHKHLRVITLPPFALERVVRGVEP